MKSMEHLSEEQLIELYYGQIRGAKGSTPGSRHLGMCSACTRAYEGLRTDLGDLRPLAVPSRSDAYGRQVWETIADRLPSFASPKRPWYRQTLGIGLMATAACAFLVVSSFFAGRQWEHRLQPHTTAAAHPSSALPEKRVLVVVLGDHLERSERLLVQLKHANADDTELSSPLRDEARTLLAANRACRREAESSGDPALTQALDKLDQLLTELANHQGALDADAIARLQQQMNQDGLLFEVRVLRARIPDSQAANRRPSNTHPSFKGGVA